MEPRDNPAPGAPHAGQSALPATTDAAPLRLANMSAPMRRRLSPAPGSVGELCLQFIRKITAKFGAQSRQRATVVEALLTFKRGQLSKRQAHINMSQVLTNDQGLQEDLLRILDHPQAVWSPGDFLLPEQAASPDDTIETLPEFLQPQHQAQLPMPSTPSDWVPAPQTPPSYAQPFLPMPLTGARGAFSTTPVEHNSGQGGYGQYGNATRPQQGYVQSDNIWNSFPPSGYSSSVPSMPNELPSEQYNTQLVKESSQVQPNSKPSTEYNLTDFGQEMTDFILEGGWQDDNVGTISPHFYETVPPRAPYSKPDIGTSLASVDQPVFATAGPAGGPQASTESLLGPNNEYQSPVALSYDHDHGQNANLQGLPPGSSPAPSPFAPPSPLVPQQSRAAESRDNADQYRFIHGLCGAAFKNRYSVKKHHWGLHVDDVNTTTGCWNKCGKPNRPWDEHPSCAYDTAQSRAARTVQTSRLQNIVADAHAPTVPSMVACPNNLLPGFPDLNDLPSTVAGIVNAGPVFSEQPYSQYSTQPSSRDKQGMESLLSAVGVVSNGQAPQDSRQDSFYDSNSQFPRAMERAYSQASPVMQRAYSQASPVMQRAYSQAPPAMANVYPQAPPAADQGHLQASPVMAHGYSQAPPAMERGHVQAPSAVEQGYPAWVNAAFSNSLPRSQQSTDTRVSNIGMPNSNVANDIFPPPRVTLPSQYRPIEPRELPFPTTNVEAAGFGEHLAPSGLLPTTEAGTKESSKDSGKDGAKKASDTGTIKRKRSKPGKKDNESGQAADSAPQGKKTKK